MKSNFIKRNSLIRVVESALVSLAAPINLRFMWNFGSLLIVCLLVQFITGILLAGFYTVNMPIRFFSLIQFIEEIFNGWFIRYVHANGASFFFFCLYIHIGRGLYYSSYMLKNTWISGVSIFILTIATAFLGYVLPLNQISFWGTSVITNLFSEVPVIGKDLVKVLWSGISVLEVTVSKFFRLHFLLPFVLVFLVFLHIIFLHEKGSSNPIGLNSYSAKLIFDPYFRKKDVFGFLFYLFIFIFICIYKPLILGDDDNFSVANPSVTPIHIQPEWYFLFAYAILRSIPRKLGGVIALLFSVLIFYSLSLTYLSNKKIIYFPFSQVLYWLFINNVVILTWIGARRVEYPYILIGQIFTISYFVFYIIFPISFK